MFEDEPLRHTVLSGLPHATEPHRGTQTYTVHDAALGAVPHAAGLKQATRAVCLLHALFAFCFRFAAHFLCASMQAAGQAVFADDAVLPANALHAAHVLSPAARGRFVAVDASEALKLPGVHLYCDSRDLAPLDKRFQKVTDDTEKVPCCCCCCCCCC